MSTKTVRIAARCSEAERTEIAAAAGDFGISAFVVAAALEKARSVDGSAVAGRPHLTMVGSGVSQPPGIELESHDSSDAAGDADEQQDGARIRTGDVRPDLEAVTHSPAERLARIRAQIAAEQ
jgi:hypothetical protein